MPVKQIVFSNIIPSLKVSVFGLKNKCFNGLKLLEDVAVYKRSDQQSGVLGTPVTPV